MRDEMHWDYVAILLLLSVVVPWNGARRVQAILRSPMTRLDRIGLYVTTVTFQWSVAAIIAWRCIRGGISLQSLGLQFPHPLRQIASILVISAFLVTSQLLAVRRIAHQPPDDRGQMARLAEQLVPRSMREGVIAILLLLTVAICEEFIYRGFIEIWFQTLTSSVVGGGIISAAFFAVAHCYQGRRGVLNTFLVGLILSAVRIWTDGLLASMVIHLVVDLSAGIAFSRIVRVAAA